MIHTRREKILVIAGAIIVAATMYIFYFLIPHIQNTDTVNSQYLEAQTKLSTLEAEVAATTMLKDDVTALDVELANQGSSMPAGVDHARILLYLDQITVDKVQDLNIVLSGDATAQDQLLIQGVTMEFRTSYDNLVKILDDLKKNELFCRVALLTADYLPVNTSVAAATPEATAGETAATTIATATPAPDATLQPGETPAPTPDVNVISVHLELTFYAVAPTEAKPAEGVLSPNTTTRQNPLFPLE